MNILVVDDDGTNRKLLRVKLEEEGHCVFEAGDGVQALEVLARESVEGIISDVLMPNMDGYRFCLEVRRNPRLSALPFVIYTELLRIALQNLLANAWKFTAKKAMAHIDFGVKQEANQPVYFVRDNGAGFDMAKAENLFSAFQRLHDKTDFPGTGIGLTTVERSIRRHGGRMCAESVQEQETTFYFTLPAERQSETSAKAGGLRS